MPTELIRTIEAVLVIAGVVSVCYAVVRSNTTKQTIQSQKELIDVLSSQVGELRTLHSDNEKAIAKLSGQLEVYKEIPLKNIAESLEKLALSQGKILKRLAKE